MRRYAARVVLRRNELLAERRVRLGLTQQQLAELVNDVVRRAGHRWSHTVLDADYVSRLETGRITWPNAVYRAAFREVLDAATEAELGFYCQQVQTARAEVDGVRRRDFLATLPAVAITSAPLGELVAAATAAPAPPPRRVGLEHAAQVRDLARQAHELDNVYGGGLAREVIAAQVRWAVGLLDAHVDRAAGAELPSAVGHLCSNAGFAAHDSGMDDVARFYYAAALRCAERADDWHLRGRALSVLAQVAAYSGQGDDALTFAQQAGVRADRLGPLRRVRVALQEARAHAQLGNARACLAAIGRAEDEFATADPASDPCPFGSSLFPAELMAESGSALATLALRGQHADTAVHRLREAVAGYPDTSPRSGALATLRLATLLLHTGDPTEATHAGDQALDTATTIQSARITDAIRDLHHAASHHRGHAAADHLRRRTARALTVS